MADQDYKLCPFMTLTVIAKDCGEGAVCAKEHCAWYDEDAEMCAVPMLSCSLRTAATARRASGGSAGLESAGFAPAGRACAKAQRRDCWLWEIVRLLQRRAKL